MHIAITKVLVSVLFNVRDVRISRRAEQFSLAQKNELEKRVNPLGILEE